MRILLPLGLIVSFCHGASRLTVGRVDGPVNFKISPEVIEMGAFYSGAMVKVEGLAQTGAKIIVTVAGADSDESFDTKGRVGPIWLNAGRIHVSGVPSLFFRFSAEPVQTLHARDEIDSMRLDGNSLLDRMLITPRTERADGSIDAHYLALKQAQGAYRFGDSGVIMGQPGAQGTPFSLEFEWPRRAAPGDYQVHVYEVRDRTVIRESSAILRAVRAGYPAWLSTVAEERSSLYGIVAIAAAVLAGFGIDLVTMLLLGKKKRQVAH